MDLLQTNSTTNSTLTPVFADNVQDLLGTGTINVNPSAIITVNSIADAVDNFNSGVTTLRDAIDQANGDTGEDLIVFDRSLFSNAQTIGLNLGELDITHNLDIIAPRDTLTGADLVTVSANNASRVFEIGSGASAHFDGLIVADGKVTGDDGGGIKNSGILTLDSSIVRNNYGFRGGAIFNDNGASLMVNNSTINSNLAGTLVGEGGGAGIYNTGTVQVNNSTISGNSTNGTSGGIYNTGTVDVRDSTISSNSTRGDGGGIYNTDILNVNNSTISSNSGRGNGGGIYNSGIVDVCDSTISSNSARESGGGIFNSNGANLTVSNSTLSSNFAESGSGGGISNSNNANLTVSNSTLSSNSVGIGSGGGIDNNGTMNVSNSTLSGNRANSYLSTLYNRGGGIYNTGISTVSNSTLIGNVAGQKGGGIYNSAGATLTLVFSTLTLNSAANGGGVFNGPEFYPPAINSPPGTANVGNTIIAANLLSTNNLNSNLITDGVNPDVSGTFSSNGYNLIGDSTGSTGFDATGDIVGTSDNPIDPRLAPLDFNGGPTQTIALLPDSPAIDAGDPTVLNTDPTSDQRGFPRVSNVGSDIGAFEFS